jgi:GR25 family glycosyltransferase involved in LPS biosynthesis
MLTPICVFTYNRLNETRQTLEALRENYLASESDLFIFSDGARNEPDQLKVEAVRQYIQSVSGFKSVEIKKSEENRGLASSIIHGVSQMLQKYEKIIVLEDDLITSPNFLNFMNQALVYYQNDPKIQSISGYSLSLKNKNREVYFQTRTESWGWATWSNRWDPNIFDKNNLKALIRSNPSILKEFKKKCGADISQMLLDSITSKNDSWYVRWAFDHFTNKHYAVYPVYSFITNIGYSADATHCKGIDTYISEPVSPQKIIFDFIPFQPSDSKSNSEFLHYFSLQHKIRIRMKLIKTATGRTQLFKEVKMKLGLI